MQLQPAGQWRNTRINTNKKIIREWLNGLRRWGCNGNQCFWNRDDFVYSRINISMISHIQFSRDKSGHSLHSAKPPPMAYDGVAILFWTRSSRIIEFGKNIFDRYVGFKQKPLFYFFYFFFLYYITAVAIFLTEF